jgi:hypothetical protein
MLQILQFAYILWNTEVSINIFVLFNFTSPFRKYKQSVINADLRHSMEHFTITQFSHPLWNSQKEMSSFNFLSDFIQKIKFCRIYFCHLCLILVIERTISFLWSMLVKTSNFVLSILSPTYHFGDTKCRTMPIAFQRYSKP